MKSDRLHIKNRTPKGHRIVIKRTFYKMSDIQIAGYLSLAYNDSQIWSQYLRIYYDLFTSEMNAIVKSKTRSIIHMCIYLQERGCSHKRIHLNLIKQAAADQMTLDQSLLRFDSLFSFCCALSEIEDG